MDPVDYLFRVPDVLRAIFLNISWPQLDRCRVVCKLWRDYIDNDFLSGTSVRNELQSRSYADEWANPGIAHHSARVKIDFEFEGFQSKIHVFSKYRKSIVIHATGTQTTGLVKHKVYLLDDWEMIKTLEHVGGEIVRVIIFSNLFSTIAIGGEVLVWDWKIGERVANLTETFPEEIMFDIEMTTNQDETTEELLLAYPNEKDIHLHLWSPKRTKVQSQRLSGHGGDIILTKLTNTFLLISGRFGEQIREIKVFQRRDGEFLFQRRIRVEKNQGRVKLMPGDNMVAIGSTHCSVHDLKTGNITSNHEKLYDVSLSRAIGSRLVWIKRYSMLQTLDISNGSLKTSSFFGTKMYTLTPLSNSVFAINSNKNSSPQTNFIHIFSLEDISAPIRELITDRVFIIKACDGGSTLASIISTYSENKKHSELHLISLRKKVQALE